MSGYLYFIKLSLLDDETKLPVYKIGKTKQQKGKRFSAYPKDAEIIQLTMCKNYDQKEKELIKLFNKKYKLKLGNEYFSGVEYDMLTDFINITLDRKDTDNAILHKTNTFIVYSVMFTIFINLICIKRFLSNFA